MCAEMVRRGGAGRQKFDSLEQEAYLNLWRTFDRLKAIEEDLLAAFELSAQQYNALRLLHEAAPATLPTLSLGARLVSRAPDITRLLDRLESRGLVHRERRAANRRVVQVGITPEGTELLQAMQVAVEACGRRQLGHLSPARLESLVALLKEARAPHESRSPNDVSSALDGATAPSQRGSSPVFSPS